MSGVEAASRETRPDGHPGAAAARKPDLPPLWWCKTCKEPARRPGGKPVHAATGNPAGPDGHRVIVTDEDPVLRAEADRIEAEYLVKVSARFGFLRADTLDPLDPSNWEGDNYHDLVRKLPVSLRRPGAGR